MIVHQVKIGKPKKNAHIQRRHKTIFVGSTKTDIKYRDMLVYFRQRWEFYIRGTLDFSTFDYDVIEPDQWKQIAEKKIRESDGVMMIVSANTAQDSSAVWQIDCALSNNIPIVGVDVRYKFEGNIPEKLVERMTRYGWEWFAEFINSL